MSDMTTPTVLQFMQKTAQDEGLRQQLGAILGVGDGDISSQAQLDVEEAEALKGDRAPAVVEFAAKQGFGFSVEELRTVVDAFQRYQAGELTDAQLAKLVGLSSQDSVSQESLPAIAKAVELVYRGTRYQKIDGRLVPIGQPQTSNVLQFMQKTAQDEGLRQQLGAILGVGDGDISSQAELDVEEAAALKGDRAPAVVEFAAKQGFGFSVEELRTVVDAFQRYQAGELTDAQLAKLVGLSSQDSVSQESLPAIAKAVELVYRGTRYQKIDGRLVPIGQPQTSNVLQFMQKTAQDEGLRQQLGAILGVGDGDISSQAQLDVEEAAALKGDRAPAVVEFAAKQGFGFSVEELRTVVDAFQRYQAGELTDAQLAKLVGLSSQDSVSQESLPAIAKAVELVYRGTRYQKIDGRLVPIGQPTQPKMSKVLQFMQKTAEDERLRQQLGAILGVGDGDISSQAALDVEEAEALKGDRAPAVVEFAAKQGFGFSVEELRTVVDAFQRYQAGELTDDDFAKLIGLSSLNQQSKESFPSIKKIVDFVQRSIRSRK
jgi:uncharacterized protein YihD (DUF1040 family)